MYPICNSFVIIFVPLTCGLVAGKLKGYQVGDLVRGEVSQVGEDYIHLNLESGVEARATGRLIAGETDQLGSDHFLPSLIQ